MRNFLIHLATLFVVTKILPGLTYTGGFKSLAIGAIGLMVINLAVVPVLKLMFLPLNLLTLGFFTWVVNVIALYLLITILPQFKLLPYFFPGMHINGFMIPPMQLSILHVAILASFLVGFTSHFLQWLVKK